MPPSPGSSGAESARAALDPVSMTGPPSEPTTLSAADSLYVLAQYVRFMLAEKCRPDQTQIRRTIGPVEEVYKPAKEIRFKRQNLLLASRHLVEYADPNGRLPHPLRLHGIDCAPGELLIALAQSVAADKLPDFVSVEPTAGVPECVAMDCFSKATAGSGHATPGYTPTQIHLQGRLQSWSYRPAGKR